jgi:hypothetical protein
MNAIRRPLPLVLVIAVAASSGALASTLVQRPTIAASAPAAQDLALTNLLKYVKVDSKGDVTITTGGKITIKGNGVDIETSSALTLISTGGVATISASGSDIKLGHGMILLSGDTVNLNAPLVTLRGAPIIR